MQQPGFPSRANFVNNTKSSASCCVALDLLKEADYLTAIVAPLFLTDCGPSLPL